MPRSSHSAVSSSTPATLQNSITVIVCQLGCRTPSHESISRWRSGLKPSTHWFHWFVRASQLLRRLFSQSRLVRMSSGSDAPPGAAAVMPSSARNCGGGGIYASPAVPGEPYFGPSVGVGLAHDHVAVHRIGVSALVTRHHAGGHSGGAHQKHETRGEVLAESLLGVEQELVHRVLAERGRLQRVLEAAAAE